MSSLPDPAASGPGGADGADGAAGGLGRPVERFKPTTGTFVGYVGLAAVAVTVVYVALAVHTVVGLRLALGALFAGVLVWASQLRPRATAYPRVLRLRSPLADTLIPYAAIDEVTVTQMLNVFVGDKRYVCVGIGRPLVSDLRSSARDQRRALKGGRSRLGELSQKAELAQPDQTAMSYTTFVTTRIEELVDQARRDAGTTDAAPAGTASEVRRRPAVPELVALGVTGVAFVVSLLV